MSHTNLLIHIIFRTKASIPAIDLAFADELYRYIWGIIKNKDCILYRINGIEDHVHLFVGLNGAVSVSELVRDVKANSSRWLKESKKFPLFECWASEYAAFSYAEKEKKTIVNYIKNQREHHKKVNFRDELMQFYRDYGLEEKYNYFFKNE